MIILEKALVTLLLVVVITGVLILIFIENDKTSKILEMVLMSELIAFLLSFIFLIWIY